MNIDELINIIESHKFAAEINIASNFNMLLDILQKHEIVNQLDRIISLQENCNRVIYRIEELSEKEIDIRYENPWDTALAVYLWVLNSKFRHIAKDLASLTLTIQQCWWANKISRYILLINSSKNTIEDQFIDTLITTFNTPGEQIKHINIDSKDTSDSLFFNKWPYLNKSITCEEKIHTNFVLLSSIDAELILSWGELQFKTIQEKQPVLDGFAEGILAA